MKPKNKRVNRRNNHKNRINLSGWSINSSPDNSGPVSYSDPRVIGFPDFYRVRLTYVDLITIAPGSNVGTYVFRGNSCFDPDFTGIGHQPTYYDQLALIYSRYRVFSSAISASVVNGSASAVGTLCVLPSTNVLAPPNVYEAMQLPYARKTREVPVGGGRETAVSHSITTAKILGLKNREIMDTDYSAAVGNNPLSQWYWNCVASANGNVNLVCQFTIHYDVEFYDRVDQGTSFAIQDPELIPKAQRLDFMNQVCLSHQKTGQILVEEPYTNVKVINSVNSTILNSSLNVKILPLK